MDARRLLLVRGLAALAVDYDDAMVDRLLLYIEELERWNPVYGLVNASGDDLVIKHVLDSLAPFRIIESLLREYDGRNGAKLAQCDGAAAGMACTVTSIPTAHETPTAAVPATSTPTGPATVSDLGSGAGLPGIPLSIIFPKHPFLLYERMDKRVRFLEMEKLALGLSNVEICEAETSQPLRPYEVAVFRAFRPFSETKLFRAIWRNTRDGGALVAYKGKPLNAHLELESLKDDQILAVAADHAQVLPVWVPFLDEERCVVVLRKP